MITLQTLLDDSKCDETVRALRWPEGVACPHCQSKAITKQGFDQTQPVRQKYRCSACQRYFDELTATVFAGHHQPLQVWIGCLYLMGLNLSNQQIAKELGLNKDDVHAMTEQLHGGIVAAAPEPRLSGEVECDAVYVVAGHKGNPATVEKKADQDGGDG